LRVNRRIAEPKARLTQRLATLLEQRSYSRALHLHRSLVRAGALTDEVAYQLAYAAVRAGRYDRAESLLRAITSPPYLKRTRRLIELVAACRGKPWLCL
jgi:lipopolysaccharide biosynthesis regulator YciM